jgi:hypothetical protein
MDMKHNNPILHSLGHAILVFLYVTAVAWIMSNGSKIFGQQDTFLIPVGVLLLFVLSAAITGTLVLGRPILLYVSGHKPEAFKFFGYTLAWLFIIVLIVFSSNLLLR